MLQLKIVDPVAGHTKKWNGCVTLQQGNFKTIHLGSVCHFILQDQNRLQYFMSKIYSFPPMSRVLRIDLHIVPDLDNWIVQTHNTSEAE